jgi:hypothetical protein
VEHLKEKWRKKAEQGGPEEDAAPPPLPPQLPPPALDEMDEEQLEEALLALLAEIQRVSMSREEQALSTRMLDSMFEPGALPVLMCVCLRSTHAREMCTPAWET